MDELDQAILDRGEINDYIPDEEEHDYEVAEYIEEEAVDFTQIKATADQQQVQELLNRLNDIDISVEERDKQLQELYDLQPNLVIEYVNNLCSSYTENRSNFLREFIFNLIKDSQQIHFILKIQAADCIEDLNLLIYLLQEVPKMKAEDLDVAIIVAYSKVRLLYTQVYQHQVPPGLEKLFTFLLQNPMIKDVDKLTLLREILDPRPYVRLAKLTDPCKWFVFCLQILNYWTMLQTEDLEQAETLMIKSQTEKNELQLNMITGVLYDFYLSLEQPEFEAYKTKAKDWFASSQKKGLYQDEQNIHHVSAEVETFLETIWSVDLGSKTVNEWYDEYKKKYDSQLCIMALERMSVDLSVYGSKSLNLKQIFVRSMLYIEQMGDQANQLLLKERMKEELEDAAQTCSTGHLIRLMNVFSGINNFVKVDPHAELRQCIFYRIQKAIEKMDDETKEKIVEALADEDTLKRDEVFQKYCYETFSIIHDSLQQEYVDQGLMTPQAFTEQYRDSLIAFSL
jgi:hypothetical protein